MLTDLFAAAGIGSAFAGVCIGLTILSREGRQWVQLMDKRKDRPRR